MTELEDIQAEGIHQIQQGMKEIYGVWKEIGLSKRQQHERVKAAWDHINTLVQDIKNEEIALSEELKDQIKSLTHEISGLQYALSVEPLSVSGLTYLQRLETLQQEHTRLSNLKNKRMKELNELRIIEQSYCELLDMNQCKLSFTTEVPSDEDLRELQQHISMLNEEHAKRYAKYREAKRELSTILEVTEATPETPLEKHICSDKEPSSLSKSTFQEIEDIIARARQRKEELESKKKELMYKLNLLWDRLSIDSNLRVEFMSNHMDCKTSTLLAIQNEIEKYEVIKKQNLQVFIQAVKKELEQLWDKCGASDAEKELFTPYFSDSVTEGILTIHEEEVESWKKYYEEVKHILEKINKRNKFWELLKVLDSKSNDPERFKNRGGKLLQEEKERNKLLRNLPTLEQEITEAIDKYEAETRKIFLYLGEDYRRVISNQWRERLNSKENLKQDKLQTPAKRSPFPTPKKSPAPKFAVYRSGKTPQRAIQKRHFDALKAISENVNDNPSSSNATSYPDFEAELNRTGRKSLRSSVVASKKIGGTRTPLSCRKKSNTVKKRASLVAEEQFSLASVRGKAGLPFLL